MSKENNILVCDDDETLCYLLKEQLLEEGFAVQTVYDGKDAIESVKSKNYDVLLLDLNMKEVSGEEVLKFVTGYTSSLQVIILTAQSDIKKAINCIKLGAYDFISKPYDFEDLILTINRAIEHKNLLVKTTILEEQINKNIHSKIIGSSKEIQKIITLANKSAQSESNVLIEGETGTGKELLAEYVHRNSLRKDKPFVVINCASLPDQLIESELFGHEKGAFTDAKSAKQGLVEIADGGTLFLDEIGEMSITLQPKILRFLESGEYRRIGGVSNLTSDVRVIGATNRNLLDETESKNFRRDLLFRLNVITLTLPPLRERKGDILQLANHFLEVKSPIRSPKRLSSAAEILLSNYTFPGNVRELDHIIERAIIFASDDTIKPEDLNLPSSDKKDQSTDATSEHTEIVSMEEIEKKHIENALNYFKWDRAKTAYKLGISIKTLYSKIKKYSLTQ
ncbi:MAG: sigma-54-dependent Fis family transcriptional regulator [Ignavibacteriales bacterium CG12_big_fil_rev_8_21_14_0_65_30_8]|nr:MAG: sigma-54-dependent Fis family transcriptional regulator [Ignavibacteriales bacterium CG12_big_fil_rev_8_21_14_0_65_30_8]